MKKRWKKALASLRMDGDITMAANRAGLNRSAVAYRVQTQDDYRQARDHGLAERKLSHDQERDREVQKAIDAADQARKVLIETRRALNRELPNLGRNEIDLRVRRIGTLDAELHACAKVLQALLAEPPHGD